MPSRTSTPPGTPPAAAKPAKGTVGGTPPAATATTPPPPTADEIAAAVMAKITALPPKPAIKPNDPVELQLLKSQQPDGKFNIFARVLNIADKGLSKREISFICEGKRWTADTDKQGNTDCPLNPLTAPADGKELRLSAFVSGIRDLTVMHIIKRVVKTPAQIAKDKRNNTRAKVFFVTMLALWLVSLAIALFFGLGRPLVDYSKTTLSEQQAFFNSLPNVKGTEREIKPDQAPGDQWQKPFFLGVLLWTAFSLIYGLLSCREEVTEAFRQGMEKLIDLRYNSSSARDPLFQRLLAFSGHLRTARIRETPTSAAAGSTPSAAAPIGKNTFWELFRSDLVSDFVTNVLPGILKAIFRV